MAEFKYNKVNSVGVNHGTKVYGRKSAPDVGVTDQKEGIDISYHNEKVGLKTLHLDMVQLTLLIFNHEIKN